MEKLLIRIPKIVRLTWTCRSFFYLDGFANSMSSSDSNSTLYNSIRGYKQ